MNFKIGEPVPEILRNSLNEILEKRDYTIISVKKGMASETAVSDLLSGSKVTSHSIATVYEMVRYGMSKCDEFANLYIRLKNIIDRYNTRAAEVRL